MSPQRSSLKANVLPTYLRYHLLRAWPTVLLCIAALFFSFFFERIASAFEATVGEMTSTMVVNSSVIASPSTVENFSISVLVGAL